MLPRRYYREVARELAEINDPKAQAGVQAINLLLEERTRLAQRVNKAENGVKKEVECTPIPQKSTRSWMETLFGWW